MIITTRPSFKHEFIPASFCAPAVFSSPNEMSSVCVKHALAEHHFREFSFQTQLSGKLAYDIALKSKD